VIPWLTPSHKDNQDDWIPPITYFQVAASYNLEKKICPSQPLLWCTIINSISLWLYYEVVIWFYETVLSTLLNQHSCISWVLRVELHVDESTTTNHKSAADFLGWSMCPAHPEGDYRSLTVGALCKTHTLRRPDGSYLTQRRSYNQRSENSCHLCGLLLIGLVNMPDCQ
jgi:hypothetical protein